VIILSPYHQFHSASILSTAHQAYQTPLGIVPVDLDSLESFSASLREQTGVKLQQVSNDQEHAIEILLPFFQRILPDEFKILPVMIRHQDPQLMSSIGTILADMLKTRKGLLAASTDLSHFHTAEKAQKLDQTIIDQIRSLNPEGLFQARDQGTGSACGLGALAAVIWAAKAGGPVAAHHLYYAHSGDITGDLSSVVGYTADVLTREHRSG
jgi:AmmeMemoRadiSam system protein B